MKRKILTVLAILLGLAGLGVLLYPSVSNWMEQAKQRRQIAAYQEAQAQMEGSRLTIQLNRGYHMKPAKAILRRKILRKCVRESGA